ncbi:hypothetical protein DFQ27_005839 [Actinomortierella ambigua]|uniref:Uncharacterized protein n=1 Tax=Actinomortierella ambigua TaxID=1343610 RepID=A0A9P6QLV6_9FUNG|nr:hypothetical protein DFQ27_005839 [Actinomortierella ambigua]
MLGSDSGSSDLSEVDASSSSSEEDMTLDHRIPSKNPNPPYSLQGRNSNIPPNLTPPKKRLPQSTAMYRTNLAAPSTPSSLSSFSPGTTSGKKGFSKKHALHLGVPTSISLSSSGSDSDSLSSDLSDSDVNGSLAAVGSQKSRGKRLPAKSNSTASSSKHGPDPIAPKGAPISLTDSQPVYSQEIMDGSLMLPPHARFNKNTGQSKPHRSDATTPASRGAGKKGGRVGRGLLAGGSKTKGGGASEAVVIDFDDEDDEPYVSLGSNSTTPLPPILVTPNPSSLTPKSEKKIKAAASKSKEKKTKAKKGKQPSSKQADQEVYCVCRGTYDGSEFMIACDRCEGE